MADPYWHPGCPGCASVVPPGARVRNLGILRQFEPPEGPKLTRHLDYRCRRMWPPDENARSNRPPIWWRAWATRSASTFRICGQAVSVPSATVRVSVNRTEQAMAGRVAEFEVLGPWPLGTSRQFWEGLTPAALRSGRRGGALSHLGRRPPARCANSAPARSPATEPPGPTNTLRERALNHWAALGPGRSRDHVAGKGFADIASG